ncbi:uncharacterized protein LOC130409507 isoform X2 [Triplophysa dalaica]|uniref:uncharacterized protein LOC130409507 isoform X2 n=1 Tax=Triplophysa dalaica TaxID=1582913 RepID=UPI0024DFD878|nr:uncharacterized protein LOC130409507 isoform X2 [Triplophysa dalaica]
MPRAGPGRIIAWILMCQIVEVRGAVIGDEIVKVKEGDTVDKIVDISGLKLVHIRVLHKCETWKIVFLYCSPGEEKEGCLNTTSPRISVHITDEKVSIALHDVTTSDSGSYIFEANGDEGMEAKRKRFQVVVEPLELNRITKHPPLTPTDTSINYITLVVVLCTLVAVGLLCFISYKLSLYIKQNKLEPHHHSSVQSSDCEDEASDDSITTGDKKTAMNHETSSQPSQHHNLLRPSQPSRHIRIPVTNTFSQFSQNLVLL